MNKVIIEVGSTCTKVDRIDDTKQIYHVKTQTIRFKKNYQEKKKIVQKDIQELIELILEQKRTTSQIYLCGTSIFRTLPENEKQDFIQRIKKETGVTFDIISMEKENELTVLGATRFAKEKVGILVGGGGSTEITIYDQKTIEEANTPFGVMDILKAFPDLGNDFPTTKLEEVKSYIKERLNLPKSKSDVLILCGGAHKYFALHSGYCYQKNSFYEDSESPIMMDIKTRIEDTKRYFESVSLEKIKKQDKDPKWWDATRCMCALVLVVAEQMEAKYIVPTDISMVYGLMVDGNY